MSYIGDDSRSFLADFTRSRFWVKGFSGTSIYRQAVGRNNRYYYIPFFFGLVFWCDTTHDDNGRHGWDIWDPDLGAISGKEKKES